MTTLDFYFDPICPWCWITSRWLREAAPQRDVTVRWRPFSLFEKNYRMGGGHGNEEFRERYERTHRMLRVLEATREGHGDDAVDRLYLELGRRFHHDRDRDPALTDVLATADLPTDLAAAADDTAWDVPIKASMDRAIEIAGYDVGVPLLVFDDERGFFGPVLSPRPTGDEALELFDAVRTLAGHDSFWEIKRDRSGRPEVGDRP